MCWWPHTDANVHSAALRLNQWCRTLYPESRGGHRGSLDYWWPTDISHHASTIFGNHTNPEFKFLLRSLALCRLSGGLWGLDSDVRRVSFHSSVFIQDLLCPCNGSYFMHLIWLTSCRCYDVCTSAPPVTSPPCSLSSSNTESEYAAPSSLTDSAYAIPSSTSNANPTSSPEPGAAYTEKSASDSIAPALDDSKALVMAEMPKADSSVPNSPAASPAVEFRLANANAEGAAVESSNLVEAPANMREAALAKVMANNNRKPKTDNVPCWDKPWCKEVQLGIPSPTSSQASAEPSITSTEEPSSSTAANTPVSTIVDAAAPASTEAPA